MSDVNVNHLGQKLVDLHASGEMLVLPTVWDAWGARLAEEAGFSAVTVGSHPVAEAFGQPDGEHQDLGEYLRQVEKIAEAVNIPVSVDVEAGYGLTPGTLVERVLEAGGVGINLEDTVHSDDGRVRGLREHADYIATAVEAAREAGVPFVVNGRTDALVHGAALFEDPLGEAEARCVAMEEAGALSVYPVKLPTEAAIRTVVEAVSVPVNVTANPAVGVAALGGGVHGDVARLRELGVRRVSFGPLWQAALREHAAGMLKGWV